MRLQLHRIRWPLVVLSVLACTESRALFFSDAGTPIPGGKPTSQISRTFRLPPQWQIDLLFVIDNSASMAPKRGLLLEGLAKMMRTMEKLEGGLPDVHIGVVSTDVGAGEGVVGGDCSALLGDQGLLWGNDPTPGALATLAGKPGNGCGLMRGVRWIEDRICPDGSRQYRNYEGELADVLSCMGGALGNHGCGYSHALQSLRLALNPIQGINEANNGFLRRRAPLVIIIVSDKDDCSAYPRSENNDGLFSAKNPGDGPTLRCAARGHVCGGREIPNYDPSTGYDGTQGPWTFGGSCAAKEPDSAHHPQWLPLISVQDAIDSVRGVKSPEYPIFVAGVIGWPKVGVSWPEYKIDKGAGSGLWELSPICGVPTVEGEGGKVYPAYRLQQFLDAFPGSGGDYPQGITVSMCDNRWERAIAASALATCCWDMANPCIDDPLVDSDPITPGIQPDCYVTLTIQGDNSGECGGEAMHHELVPECVDPATGLAINPKNSRPQLDTIPEGNRPCWYLLHDPEPMLGCPNAPRNQKLALLFKPGQFPPPEGMWTATCQTEPRP